MKEREKSENGRKRREINTEVGMKNEHKEWKSTDKPKKENEGKK
jgi:hypothetical protein